MRSMGEPEGREGQDRALEASALPEGAAVAEESAAGAAQRDRVPPFHPGPIPAASLDLLVSMNEPELLIRELKKIAGQYPKEDKRWLGVLRICERGEEYFDHINKPQAHQL
jgi:hypothetical protein